MVQTKTKAKKKSFSAKLTKEEKFHGRYMGGSPFQAASKALTEILRRGSIKPGNKIVFCLKEITQKSANKRHFYLGERVKLKEPVVYTVDGNEIRKEFKNQIRKLRNSELGDYIDDLELAGGAKKKTKTVTKKTVAKKTTAKKTTVKKTTAKKTVAKKTKAVVKKATKAVAKKTKGKKVVATAKKTTKSVKAKATKKTKGKSKKKSA